MNRLGALVLAAGKGTRMKSEKIKIIHELNGIPLIFHLLRTLRKAEVQDIALVVGYQQEAVKAVVASAFPEVAYIYQQEQLGTGHAVLQSRQWLAQRSGSVLVLPGDCPLLRPETLCAMTASRQESGVQAVVLAAHKKEPGSYGRVLLDETGNPRRIVEAKDATEEERACTLVNAGVYAFEAEFLEREVQNLRADNVQKEYYITDLIALTSQARLAQLEDETEVLGVNSRVDLADLAARLKRRTNAFWQLAGVTLIDPENTYIEEDVSIGTDTIIYPGAYIEKGVKIGSNCLVGPHMQVRTNLADGCCYGAKKRCAE